MTATAQHEPDALVAAATAGDEGAFSQLFDRHRGELQVHCYRMLGSFDESEDLTQETFLRAWRKRATFKGRSTYRAWLYRIATNACLDQLDRAPRKAARTDGGFEVTWLEPYPDELLDAVPTDEAGPDATVVAKETVELAFMVAIQHLPPRQRAVLLVRDVLGWSAKETAALLDSSVASVNSALQRARGALKEHLPERRLEWPADRDATEEERELVQRFLEATERGDLDGLADLLSDDAHFCMPPEPFQVSGGREIVESWKEGGLGTEEYRDWIGRIVYANRQPAVAWYLKKPGDAEHKAFALDVLRIEGGEITQVLAFPGAVLSAFGLPETV